MRVGGCNNMYSLDWTRVMRIKGCAQIGILKDENNYLWANNRNNS